MSGPRPTTFVELPALNDRLGAEIVLAVEAFQPTGSFKLRAADYVVRHIPHPSVIASSSGNFGAAIAYACLAAGKQCTVVMPSNSVQIKVEAVRQFGATVDFVDTTRETRAARVAQLAAANPDAYVASAYDDPLVITGNASLGHEIAAAGRQLDAVIVPVGGGGLASGIVQGLRESGDPTPVFGAEPLMANDAAESLRQGRIVASDDERQTVADGARTRSLGVHNWAILRTGLTTIVEVPEATIRAAVRVLAESAKLRVEPTGALTVGAVMTEPARFHGKRVCCIVSGGNADPVLYQTILRERDSGGT
ncbi:MAG TPA: threonine/serine dehydratase [Gemmatimonadaceae bacterium]|jgi:threonine dehydratase|nr:threonine/serine dehydratase [Gemmatimonadaceae bacterium]